LQAAAKEQENKEEESAALKDLETRQAAERQEYKQFIVATMYGLCSDKLLVISARSR
jgi:hypothetical protein